MFSLLMGTVLVPINSTMISVALTPMAEELHVSIAGVTWLVTVYLLMMACVQPVSGKINDRWGRKRTFIGGMAIFLTASIGCMAANSLALLVVFRAIQALGGAAMMPAAPALVRVNWTDQRLARALSVMSLVLGLGAAVGPLMGAALLDLGSWRWIFAVNLPFAATSLVVGAALLPESYGKRAAVDWGGALLLLGTLLGGVLLLTGKVPVRWYVVLPWLAWIATFIAWQRKIKHPLIRFGLFRNIGFSVANVSILLCNFTMYATLLVTPMVLHERFGVSTNAIGVYLFVFSLSMSALSGAGAHLAERVGHPRAIGLGFAAALLNSLLFWLCLSVWHLHSQGVLFGLFVLGGASAGAGIVSMQTLSLQAVAKADSGSASGLYSTFRYTGSVLASMVIAWFHSASAVVFLAMAGMSALGTLVILATQRTIGSRDRSAAVSSV
ncbi:MAG: MFS transporter [Alicyclobacillus sp.]|nr:MFS transporter [Alicyclobacillus sp.]